MTQRTVIIGGGIAGVSAASALRSQGYDGVIELISDEPELPYRRPPVSKELIRGDKNAEEIRIKKAEWFQEHGIGLHLGDSVVSIDVQSQQVQRVSGEPLPYDQLLLATGGRARNPWQARGIHTIRSLADVPGLRNSLASGAPVVIVGAGLIGSEIAASARSLGCEVTLLETADQPLPRLLPPELGQMYVDLHRAEGTQLHTGVTVSGISDEHGQSVVRSADGRRWPAPAVVVAVGMDPNIELAAAAGVALASVADGGGILVDDRGRTSVPGIFAAGDVANQPRGWRGGRQRVEHWQGAQNHGTAVGKVMAGGEQPFAEVPWCWSDQYGHNLQVVGWPESSHEMVVAGSLEEHDFIAYLLDAGVIRGAVSIGRPRDIRAARVWIADERQLADVLEG